MAIADERFWFPPTRSNFAMNLVIKQELRLVPRVDFAIQLIEEAGMGFGRGALLWLIGIPLPIILLLAIFMHH